MNSEKSSSAWLSMTPHNTILRLQDGEVSAALRSRLLQVQDRINVTKRKKLQQEVIKALKEAEYNAVVVDSDTPYTTRDDPNTRLPDSLVQTMAISVTDLNVSQVRLTNVRADADCPLLLNAYKKRLHSHAVRLQRRLYHKYYEGRIHLPFIVSTTGAVMGMTRKWIKELKQRAVLNKLPSPIVQVISSICVKSLY